MGRATAIPIPGPPDTPQPRSKEALAACNQALDLDLNCEDLWRNKASSLRALGRTAEADAAAERGKWVRGQRPGGPLPLTPSPTRGGGTRGDLSLACSANPRQHVAEMAVYLSIGEAEDEQAAPGQNLITGAVVVRLMEMNAAIEFDGDPGRMAIEINDKAINDLLASPAQTVHVVGAKTLPEQRFLWRHVPAKRSGAFLFDVSYRPTNDDPVSGLCILVIHRTPLLRR